MELNREYKQSELGAIPRDWNVIPIGDVCQIVGRIGFRGYTVNDIVKEGVQNPVRQRLRSSEFLLMKSSPRLGPLLRFSSLDFARFLPRLGPWRPLQAHLHLRPLHLHQRLACHPQVGQRKQGHHVRSVLGQPLVLDLDVTKLPFDDAKRVLDLGTNAGLGLLQLLQQATQHRVRVQHFALAGHHGHMPVRLVLHCLDFFTLLHAPVTRIRKDVFFLSMQQLVRLGNVVLVCCGGDHGVNQARVCIHANVGLHAEMPLVAFFGLVHFGVALFVLVLGRTRCGNQGGINGAALFEQQPFVGQAGVDGGQDLLGNLVCFKQMAKAQNRDTVWQSFAVGEARKLAVQRDIEQRFFHRHIAQTEPLLQQVQAQHGFVLKRWAPRFLCRRRCMDQRDQFAPRNHQLHFVEKRRFARAPCAQVQAKVLLLHGGIVSAQAPHLFKEGEEF